MNKIALWTISERLLEKKSRKFAGEKKVGEKLLGDSRKDLLH